MSLPDSGTQVPSQAVDDTPAVPEPPRNPTGSVHPMSRQCSAHNRQGQQCGRAAIPGGTICGYHGGRAPQVLAAARRRLLEAADPVAAELIRLARYSEQDSVRVMAARDVLDRAGLGAKVQVEADVRVVTPSDVLELLREMRRPIEMREEA